jgi:hypothetical protein
MKSQATSASRKKFIEEIKAKQRNTVWPGPMINSRGVDAFLWRGDPDAPLVQRMAAWIFGVAFMIAGLAVLGMTHNKQSWIDIAVSLVSFLIGGKVFLNGFRRRKAKVSKIE